MRNETDVIFMKLNVDLTEKGKKVMQDIDDFIRSKLPFDWDDYLIESIEIRLEKKSELVKGFSNAFAASMNKHHKE